MIGVNAHFDDLERHESRSSEKIRTTLLDCILDIAVTSDSLPSNVVRDHRGRNLHFSRHRKYTY